MTVQEFDKYQGDRMKKNEVVRRIDGSSCLKEEIKAFASFLTKTKLLNITLLQISMVIPIYQGIIISKR